MEALGAAASIIAIIDISIKSAVGVQALVSAIKDGPQSIAFLGRDVTSLFVVLNRLSQCRLEGTSPTTLKSLESHVRDCDAELATIQALLIELRSRSTGLADRARAGIRIVRKGKDLDQAHQRVRDLTTQLNLFLALVQAETTETTGHGLDQILHTLKKVQDRLDNIEVPVRKRKKPGSHEEGRSGRKKMKRECKELQESIDHLSELVGHDGATLPAEEAEHIIDDLRRLIKSAEDHTDANHDSSASKLTKDELRLVESLIYAAPSVSINSSEPQTSKQSMPVSNGVVIKQKRLSKDIDIGCGVLTISTKKRTRLDDGETATSRAARDIPRRDVVARFSFRQKNNAFTFSVSMTQSELFNHCLQSIPEMCFNPTLRNSSPVFRIVRQGRIDELRTMLADGTISVRVHDEDGRGLLYYAIEQPQICRLLLQAGAYVDEVMPGTSPSTTLLLAVGSRSSDTVQLLLENGADPFLYTQDGVSPMHLGCAWSDAAAVRSMIPHGGPCLRDELNDMSHDNPAIFKACGAWFGSPDTLDTIVSLVKAGADVRVRLSRDVNRLKGVTVLHVLVGEAHCPSTRDELESLDFLIRQGCDVREVCDASISVSKMAYKKNQHECQGVLKPVGGYRGDLWDAALVRCGYDLLEFRKEHPRVPRYNEMYRRADFERLWEGLEHLCPYWDDRRWPENGGDSDLFEDDSFCTCTCRWNEGTEVCLQLFGECKHHNGNEENDEDTADEDTISEDDTDEDIEGDASCDNEHRRPHFGSCSSRRASPASATFDAASYQGQEWYSPWPSHREQSHPTPTTDLQEDNSAATTDRLSHEQLVDLVGPSLGPPLTFESTVTSTHQGSGSNMETWSGAGQTGRENGTRWDMMDLDNPWRSDDGYSR